MFSMMDRVPRHWRSEVFVAGAGVAGEFGGVGGFVLLAVAGLADGGGLEAGHADLTPASGGHHIDEGTFGGGLRVVLVVIGLD